MEGLKKKKKRRKKSSQKSSQFFFASHCTLCQKSNFCPKIQYSFFSGTEFENFLSIQFEQIFFFLIEFSDKKTFGT